MENLVLFITSYLIGCISPSYILCKKIKGVDIRDYGSGNAGTTNVLRQLGKKVALEVFILDLLKGFLPVLLIKINLGEEIATVAGIFIILGHIFPVFLGFKGGKGAATSIAIYICLFPKVMLISIVVASAILYIKRYVSLSSMVVISLVTPLMLIFDYKKELIPYTLIYALLVIYSHRENVQRLVKGEERKIGK